MNATQPAKTISEVFQEFLAEQAAKQSDSTQRKYRTIIGLFESYLEGYWPGHDSEASKITAAGGTYCGTFGPAEILDGYSEFLGYFMPRKVACGKETMTAAGTVTKKLAKWLAAKGYVQDADDAEERAAEAARDLPAARDVLRLLEAYIAAQAPAEYGDTIEDHFWIGRIEPGKLWLEAMTAHDAMVGPVPVPTEVSQRCDPMWDISGVLAKTAQGWRFVEVWNVTP